MNLGFGLGRVRIARAKNTVNILSKNFIVFAVSTVAFLAIGWGLMFGDGSPFVGLKGLFFLGGADNSPAIGDAYQRRVLGDQLDGRSALGQVLLPARLRGTAATIVSGAVAERIKFLSFIVFSFLLVAFVYPIMGHWIWGGGWLAELGFWDFAGSTVVHSVGGWAALAGVIVLGPRIGKYGKDGKRPRDPRPQHDLGHDRRARLVARLVRVQPGSHDGRRSGLHLPHRGDDQHRGGGGRARSDRARMGLLGKPDIGMMINGASPDWSASRPAARS